MKNYKNSWFNAGASDIASLVIRGANYLAQVHFGGDDSYRCYLIDEDYELPTHYKKIGECESWASIIDDFEITTKIRADKIEFFRAGDFGFLIRVTAFKQFIGSSVFLDEKFKNYN